MVTSRSKKGKKRAAPYVPVSVLSGFIERIRRITAPPEITSRLLQESGISDADSFALLSALKFLNLIDERGAPTPEFRSLQTSGDEFKSNLHQIVKNAYSDLFAWLDPAVDDREHIKNFFARSYSPATAERATAVFLDLCGEAGIPTKEERRKKLETPAKRKHRPGVLTTKREAPPESRETMEPPAQKEGPRFDIRIDSKDFASMQPEQIKAFFEGLSNIVGEKGGQANKESAG